MKRNMKREIGGGDMKRNWIALFILAVLFSGIPVSCAQNTGDITIDHPIQYNEDVVQINEDLIGRCRIENPVQMKRNFYVKYGE